MDSTTILRLPRIDERDAYTVICVKKDASNKLSFTGTEGENPYVGVVKQHDMSKLRPRGSTTSDAEWQAIVAEVLLQDLSQQSLDTEGLEAVSSITGEKLQITIRRNVKGVPQNLGSISLQLNEDEEINAVEWAAIAAEAAKSSLTQAASLEQSLKNHQHTIKQLSDQLDALTKAKEEHELELLGKFAKLLNAKKMKIREQQRILATAQPDRSKVIPAQAHEQEAQARGKTNAPSRSSKRKANRKSGNDDDSESDEFESAAAGQGTAEDVKNEDDSDQDMADIATPEPSDDDMTEDDEPARTDASPAKTENTGSISHHPDSKADPPQIPPRRELPFGKSSKSAPLKQPSPDDDNETDDEL